MRILFLRLTADLFTCGNVYSGIGTSRSDLIPADFRLYLHDVRLVTRDGENVPLALEEDGI